MAKIKCPGCGADIDTESGRAEYSAPALELAPLTDAQAAEFVEVPREMVEKVLGKQPKQSRFWRRK